MALPRLIHSLQKFLILCFKRLPVNLLSGNGLIHIFRYVTHLIPILPFHQTVIGPKRNQAGGGIHGDLIIILIPVQSILNQILQLASLNPGIHKRVLKPIPSGDIHPYGGGQLFLAGLQLSFIRRNLIVQGLDSLFHGVDIILRGLPQLQARPVLLKGSLHGRKPLFIEGNGIRQNHNIHIKIGDILIDLQNLVCHLMLHRVNL